MAGSGHLRPGDGDAVVRLIDPARHEGPGPMPWSVLRDLHALFAGSYVMYQEYDVVARRWVLARKIDPGGGEHVDDGTSAPTTEIDALFFDLWWADPMLRYGHVTGDRRSVLLSSDFFPTARQVAARPYVRELCPQLRSFLTIPLACHDGYVRRITLARDDGRGFGERDRQVANLLRPHLHELWLDAERRRAGTPALSPREREVLALAASGLTYAQIAAQLFISVGTVRKHMENVRRRLGVHTATAAAAVALPSRP